MRRVASTGVGAALIGTAAGVGQGMSDAMNRLAGAWFAPHGWIPPTWVLCAALVSRCSFGLQGFVAAQNAFQRYRANTVVAVHGHRAACSCRSRWRLILFGQPGPRDGEDAAIWSLALLLTFLGIYVLSQLARREHALGGVAGLLIQRTQRDRPGTHET